MIKIVIKNNCKDSKYLFWNNDLNKELTTSFIDSFFAKTKKDLGILNLGPHLLRHTYCTFLADSKQLNIKSLQLLMGHKTLQMTMRYIHSNTKELAKFSTSLNPISQMK